MSFSAVYTLTPMRKTFNPHSLYCLVVAACMPTATIVAEPSVSLEQRYLSPPTCVTDGLTKAGEGYFSPDARQVCYQGVPAGYPFYQIYVQPFDVAAPRVAVPQRISTGRGRTTCCFFSPSGQRLLFASSHRDPNLDQTEAVAKAQAEEDARTGRRRRYQWDFDPQMDIFSARPDGRDLQQLTHTAGYDAECSYSPDGRQILFVSDRDGDPDIYVMQADGSGVRQLTNQPGYDGGPFFSPDGLWIVYRTDRVEKDMLQIHAMRADGSNDVALTRGKGVRWAPYWHPTKPWLIWTGADHSDPTARPNYDLWVARFSSGHVRADPTKKPADGIAPASEAATDFRIGQPLRLTDHEGADVLPAFSPDGNLLMWTASRNATGGRGTSSQLWVSTLNADHIQRDLAPVGGASESHDVHP